MRRQSAKSIFKQLVFHGFVGLRVPKKLGFLNNIMEKERTKANKQA